MTEASVNSGAAGAASGRAAAGRADEPSGPGGNRVAGGRAAKCGFCVRGGEPRPVFSGECGDGDRGDKSRVRKRGVSRGGELQYVFGGERSIPARAEKPA